MSSIKNMPETGFAKIKQIIGDKTSNPPTPPVFPVSKSTWWEGCRSGRFPKPVKIGPNSTAWKWSDIRDLCDRLEKEGQ
jgi:prophage regulatory protein